MWAFRNKLLFILDLIEVISNKYLISIFLLMNRNKNNSKKSNIIAAKLERRLSSRKHFMQQT